MPRKQLLVRLVQEHQDKCGDGAQEQGEEEPNQSAPVLTLRKTGVDEGQCAPTDEKSRIVVHMR